MLRYFCFSVARLAGIFFAVALVATATERPAREPAAGLLFYAKADYATADNSRVIANPAICGALFQIIWSEVEKKDGQCDWSEVDRWIAPWVKGGKKFALRVMWSTSGYWPKPYYHTPTPAWVWARGARHIDHPASQTEIPLIWDPVYRKYATRFLEQLAARYGDNPALLFVDVTPGAETNPYRFGTINRVDPGFKIAFENAAASDGRTYSDALWLDAVEGAVDAANRALPHTPLLVTLNVATLSGADRMREVGDYVAAKGVYVGQNGLGGGSYRDSAAGRTQAFLGWSKGTRLFFEMVQRSGGNTGTLMEVMQAAVRIHCNYLNVYPEDVLQGTRGEAGYDPAFEAALRYGAEALARGAKSQPEGQKK